MPLLRRSPSRRSPHPPPLENGDRLTRVEFERRYHALPERRAELVQGTVYMASPTRHEHAAPHGLLTLWLGTYAAETPGTEALPEATLRLDEANVVEPDALLRLLPERDGRSSLDPDGYLRGPVELVAEVAATTAARDLHAKREVYRAHACQEYLIVVVCEPQVIWLAHEDGDYAPLAADARGVIRSKVFPGLWLDTRALLARDAPRLLATLRRGLASAPHARFARLRRKR